MPETSCAAGVLRKGGSIVSGTQIEPKVEGVASMHAEDGDWMDALLRHVPREEIPASDDLVVAEDVPSYLESSGVPGYSLIAVGDIMLGGRADVAIGEHGVHYPLHAMRPLLGRAPVVLGNLEGPLAPRDWKLARNHSYAVPHERTAALASVGINVLSLANNHLMDCGRRGVLSTLAALEQAGLSALGAGPSKAAAHAPVVREVGGVRIGLLGYYWNRRCAAVADRPGAAQDHPGDLESDIRSLRRRVDRVVVTFHWGVPYTREPLPEDRSKARFAVDCGADLVIGHHPHVIQPFEIYRGRAIFWSLGNFAFGSGNSRGEGLLLGVRFDRSGATAVDVFPIYVKNRDPRVDYQPKLLRGPGAERVLSFFAQLSGAHASACEIRYGRGSIHVG